jgi:hypothetical protein
MKERLVVVGRRSIARETMSTALRGQLLLLQVKRMEVVQGICRWWWVCCGHGNRARRWLKKGRRSTDRCRRRLDQSSGRA